MTVEDDPSARVDSGLQASTRQPIIELAAELRALREKSHQSLRELQHSTFASDSSLSRYLAGRTVPPWPVVEALCRLGDRDPAELRAIWERARRARGKRTHAAVASNVPAVAEAVPTRNSTAAHGRAGLRLLGAAGAIVLAAVFIRLVTALTRRSRPPMRHRYI